MKQGTSKIKEIENQNRSWQSRQGQTFWEYIVSFEDGIEGVASSTDKDKPPYEIGDEMAYTLTSGPYGDKLKINRPDMVDSPTNPKSPMNGSKQQEIATQWAIGQAATQLSIDEGGLDDYFEMVEKLATKFLDIRDAIINKKS